MSGDIVEKPGDAVMPEVCASPFVDGVNRD
jgi:hypothetical protein